MLDKENAKITKKRLYEKRKSLGICVKCGKFPMKSGIVSCEKCALRETKSLKIRRKTRKDSSLCEECGRTVYESGLCEKHFQKRQNFINEMSNKRLIRRQNNLCEGCGKEPLNRQNRITNSCDVCYLKMLAKGHFGSAKLWEPLQELYNKQSICPYTGIQLILGINTSLDHIISTFNGGLNEIENLQWVYFDQYGFFDVNRMKGAMSHEDYKKAIEIQYKYLFR